MGSFSTANATATGWGSATTFGNTATFNGGANAFGSGMTMPIVRRSSRYYVIKYVNQPCRLFPRTATQNENQFLTVCVRLRLYVVRPRTDHRRQ
jgi:hypothetical protein